MVARAAERLVELERGDADDRGRRAPWSRPVPSSGRCRATTAMPTPGDDRGSMRSAGGPCSPDRGRGRLLVLRVGPGRPRAPCPAPAAGPVRDRGAGLRPRSSNASSSSSSGRSRSRARRAPVVVVLEQLGTREVALGPVAAPVRNRGAAGSPTASGRGPPRRSRRLLAEEVGTSPVGGSVQCGRRTGPRLASAGSPASPRLGRRRRRSRRDARRRRRRRVRGVDSDVVGSVVGVGLVDLRRTPTRRVTFELESVAGSPQNSSESSPRATGRGRVGCGCVVRPEDRARLRRSPAVLRLVVAEIELIALVIVAPIGHGTPSGPIPG